MKMLFLCTSEFQLMTALNIKYHMHLNDDADIIVANYHGKEKELAERIRETKLFRKVFYVREYIENESLHRYLRDLSDGKAEIELMYALKNTFLFLLMQLQIVLFGARAYVKMMIEDASELALKEYDIFFAHGTKPVTCYLAEYLSKINTHCLFYLLDEGIGTYMTPEIGKRSNVIDTYYAYAPDLMVYERKVCRIPKIRRTEKSFVSILNHVFRFRVSDVEDYRNSVVVFSQNGSEVKMPRYLKASSFLSKTLFRNSYKRHLKEEQEYQEQLRTMDIALSYAQSWGKDNNVWMKLNPRASKDQIGEYENRENVRLLRRWDLPWELLALNCPLGNNIFLTNATSAVCMYSDVIGDSPGRVWRVLLYKLENRARRNEVILFLKQLEEKRENLYAPGTIDELMAMQKGEIIK